MQAGCDQIECTTCREVSCMFQSSSLKIYMNIFADLS